MPVRTRMRWRSCALLAWALLGLCFWPSWARAEGGFLPTGSMTTPRFGAAAALLPNGKVLIVGGDSLGTSAELYDPATGTFSATGSMSTPRDGATATLLANSKVLVVGGSNTTAAELYDPATGSFAPTGSLNASRNGHTATLLANGKVLIVGGSPDDYTLPPQPGNGELYDPDSGTFTPTGPTAAAHYYHAAALLADGKVLITGGLNACWEYDGNIHYQSECAIPSAELYDPSTGAFAATGSMINPRFVHTATLLSNGKVLIAAGSVSGGTPELYDPATGAFAVTGTMMFNWREDASSTLLPNGKVLIVGGWDTSALSELYDPVAGTFFLSGITSMERTYHTATLLPSGDVLIAGGGTHTTTDSAELYRYTIAENVLLVKNVGNGGRVTSSPAGIDCGSTCTASFETGATVTLTATPDPGGTFAGWIGACSGKGTCTVTLTGAASVTAMFAAAGSVYMISPPPSGNWLRLVDPGSGRALYSVPITATGQTVLGGRGLAAHPINGELYALLAVEGTNILQLATVDIAGVALLVGPADDGSGSLDLAGITFATDGTLYGITNGHGLFRIDTSTGTATLVQQIPAGPDIVGPDSIAYNPADGLFYHATQLYTYDPEGWGDEYFAVWETIDPLSPSSPPVPRPGPCCFYLEPYVGKAATALLHRSGNFFLWANYNRLFYFDGTSGSGSFLRTLPAIASGMAPAAPLPSTFPLSVSMARGSGRVVSTPAGIDCPTTCTASFATGTLVVLTATADTGYVFDGWIKPDGDVAGSASYSVRMLTARSVVAMFPPAFTLQVTKAGTGLGGIRGAGDADWCSTTCSVAIAAGRYVYLSPLVSDGSVFAGWSGACSGTDFYCIVTMDADKSVTATFNLSSPPPDTTAPTVLLTAPASASTVSGSAVSVNASATDDVGVVGVQFKLDGANLGAEIVAPPYSLLWNTTQVANGAHTLTADARDAAGNHGTAIVTVTVSNASPPPPDTTAPTVSIAAPTGGSTVSGAAVPVSASANDNVGVVGVQFKLDGANLGAEDTTVPYAIVWDSTQVANGAHTLTASARDSAGNIGVAVALLVAVHNSAEFGIAPAAGSSTSATVSAGRTATYSLNVAPTAGFTGAISFTCTGAPQGSTCSMSPNPANVSGVSSTTITVSITTTARSRANSLQVAGNGWRPVGRGADLLWIALVPAAVLSCGSRSRRRGTRAGRLVLMLLVGLAVGCGGGGVSMTPTPTTPVRTQSGTAAGTYTIVVSGSSGTVSHSFSLQLTVN